MTDKNRPELEYKKEIAGAFRIPGKYIGEHPYGTGHINDTYRVIYEERGQERHYIHQRINHHVFKDIPSLMENIGRVVRHQRGKFEVAGADQIDRRVLTLVPSLDGKDYYQDARGNYWRTYLFIEDALGYDVVENRTQAYEAAKAYGEFQRHLIDLPVRLHETIQGFHHTRSRFDTMKKALAEDVCGRAAEVQAEVGFALQREEMVDAVLRLMDSGEIPERVTHNDTKLNNVLIDTVTGEGMCVIDLDTVMPGSVLYDFGDMVRTATGRSPEDETDLSRVEMKMDCFEAIADGYLRAASGFLTQSERDLLPFSGRLITFETGLRFLTDYLQGDLYFKTHRPEQNIDRCRVQFKMVESMERQADAMQRIIEERG